MTVVELHWRRVDGGVDVASLGAAELEHVRTIRDGRARRAQTASYALRRDVLAAELATAPGALRFERRCAVCGGTDHGKPRVARRRAAPAFSVSRTCQAVAVGTVRGCEVGIDLEAEQPASVWAAIRGKTWHEDDADLDPLAAWTAKEAVLKLIGCGLSRAPSDVRLGADGTWAIPELAERGFVRWAPLAPALLCAAAARIPCRLAVRAW